MPLFLLKKIRFIIKNLSFQAIKNAKVIQIIVKKYQYQAKQRRFTYLRKTIIQNAQRVFVLFKITNLTN